MLSFETDLRALGRISESLSVAWAKYDPIENTTTPSNNKTEIFMLIFPRFGNRLTLPFLAFTQISKIQIQVLMLAQQTVNSPNQP